MNDLPEEVRELAARREEARRGRDFASADALRERIRETGYEVTDTPQGPVLTPRAADQPASAGLRIHRSADEVESRLEETPSFDATVQWVVQGWPEDVLRGIESFRKCGSQRSTQHVVVDLAEAGVDWPPQTDVLRVAADMGWAAARNAGLRRTAGRVVIVADGSIEATADVVGPLVEALDDRTVGVTGPFGVVTDDLREFRDAEGPEVDGIEAYLMAFRRELVEAGLRFDDGFKFYRNADIELSFQIKAMGLRATVTPLPGLVRHDHRIWANTPDADRARLSKRNFYRFLDKWRGRTDLLVSRDHDRPGR
jgi:hypothetical protein